MVDVMEIGPDGKFLRGQTQRVIGVTITGPATVQVINGQSRVVIEGTKPAGFPLTQMEHEIVNPDFRNFRIKDRNIRADTAGGRIRGNNNAVLGTGFLEAIPGSDTRWRAVYTGLIGGEVTAALNGDSAISAWLANHPDPNVEGQFGLTIFEFPVTNGPQMAGCPRTGSFTIPLPLP
jgi:hypothetical protein